MSLYLCVDCGGSKTSAVICDKNRKILGRALGGPSNFAYIGEDGFRQALHTAVSDALRTCFTPASVDPLPFPPPAGNSYFAATWLGVSGVDSPSAVASVTQIVSDLFGIPLGPRINVCNDTYLLAAPLRIYQDVKYAIAVVAGTGSKVSGFKLGEDRNLQQVGSAGGWGWMLGDEGGGFNVGRETLRQILAQADRNSFSPDCLEQPSILETQVLAQFGAEAPYDLLPLVHLPDPWPSAPIPPNMNPFLLHPKEKRLSSLSPIVFSCAFEHGDALALKVLNINASALADQISSFLIPPSDEDVGDATSGHTYHNHAFRAKESIICFGGSLVGIERYRNMIVDELKRRGHIFKGVEYVEDAAEVGALGLAAALNSYR